MKVSKICVMIYLGLGLATAGIVLTLASWFAPPVTTYIARMRVTGPSLFISGCGVLVLTCIACAIKQNDCLPKCKITVTRGKQQRASIETYSLDSVDESLEEKNAQTDEYIDLRLDCPECQQYLMQHGYIAYEDHVSHKYQLAANVSNCDECSRSVETGQSAELPWRMRDHDGQQLGQSAYSSSSAQCDYPLYECYCGRCANRSTLPNNSSHVDENKPFIKPLTSGQARKHAQISTDPSRVDRTVSERTDADDNFPFFLPKAFQPISSASSPDSGNCDIPPTYSSVAQRGRSHPYTAVDMTSLARPASGFQHAKIRQLRRPQSVYSVTQVHCSTQTADDSSEQASSHLATTFSRSSGQLHAAVHAVTPDFTATVSPVSRDTSIHERRQSVSSHKHMPDGAVSSRADGPTAEEPQDDKLACALTEQTRTTANQLCFEVTV